MIYKGDHASKEIFFAGVFLPPPKFRTYLNILDCPSDKGNALPIVGYFCLPSSKLWSYRYIQPIIVLRSVLHPTYYCIEKRLEGQDPRKESIDLKNLVSVMNSATELVPLLLSEYRLIDLLYLYIQFGTKKIPLWVS